MAYNSTTGTSSSKSYAPSTGVSTDHRSRFFDTTNLVQRDYVSTAEVFSYLSSVAQRQGGFPIYINSTGTLSGGGVITGGTRVEYWFKDGTADANLVVKTSGSGGGGGVAFTQQTLSFGGTTTWNYSLGQYAHLTLTGNTTLNVTNLTTPCVGIICVTQDATGSRVITFPTGSRLESGLVLSTPASSVDKLGFTYDGTYIDWAISKAYAAPGGGGGGGGLIDLDFPTVVGLIESPSHIWKTSDPSYQSTYYMGYGLSDSYLASGQDGWIQMQYYATDAANQQLAFSLNNTNKKYDAAGEYLAGCLVSANTIYTSVGGAVVGTGIGISVGNWLRISRVGSVTKLQKSTDESSWTDVYTYSTTSTANFYININSDGAVLNTAKLYYPKGYNMT